MLRANCCYCVFLALSVASCGHQISKSADSEAHKTDNKARDSASLNYQHHGLYVFGLEVNSITLCGQKSAYWVVAEEPVQARLQQHHQALTNKPYQAAYIRFNGRLLDKASDGFAADYDGQMAIDELVSIPSAEDSRCP